MHHKNCKSIQKENKVVIINNWFIYLKKPLTPNQSLQYCNEFCYCCNDLLIFDNGYVSFIDIENILVRYSHDWIWFYCNINYADQVDFTLLMLQKFKIFFPVQTLLSRNWKTDFYSSIQQMHYSDGIWFICVTVVVISKIDVSHIVCICIDLNHIIVSIVYDIKQQKIFSTNLSIVTVAYAKCMCWFSAILYPYIGVKIYMDVKNKNMNSYDVATTLNVSGSRRIAVIFTVQTTPVWNSLGVSNHTNQWIIPNH